MLQKYNVAKWPTQNAELKAWVIEMAEMCQPDAIVWIDGSEEEKQRL
jgi:phosphoenolpyruvate carboxykinase (GTP)